MINLKTNRTLAWIVFALVLPVALVGGVNRSVVSLRGKAETLFTVGTERGGSVASDLSDMIADAGQLASVLPDASLEERIRAARESVTLTMDAGCIEELLHAASVTYNRSLTEPSLTEAQRTSAMLYYYEIVASYERVGRNADYRAAADKYNRALDSFPASLLVPGAERAVLFPQ